MQALKWAGLAKFAGQLLSWATTVVVLRLLRAEDYGLMAIVTVSTAVLASVAELGLGASVVQSQTLTEEDARRVSGLALVVNLTACLLMLLCAPLAGLIYDDPRLNTLVRVASLQFVLNAITTVPQAMAYRDMAFKRLAWIEFASMGVAGVLTLAIALLGGGVWALLLGGLCQAAVRSALLISRQRYLRPKFGFRGLRKVVEFGGAVTLSRLTWQVVYQTDVLIAGIRLAPSVLGLYSVSLHLATLPMQKLMGVVNQVAFPAFAKLQSDRPRLAKRLVEATRVMLACAVPVLWGMSAVAQELVTLVLGAKWKAAAFPLFAVCLTVPFRMVSAVFSTAVIGIGRAGLDVRCSLISAVVLPVSFLIGTHWGADGLAVSWLWAVPLVMALGLPPMFEAVGTNSLELLRAAWVPLFAGVLMFGAVFLTREFLHDGAGWVRLPAMFAAGALVYVSALKILGPDIFVEMGQLVRAAREPG